MIKYYFLIILIVSGAFAEVEAAEQHELIRRLAVFPIFSAEVELGETSGDAWWDFRESLVRDGFFFVAGRRLMVNRGVFKPRRELSRADAILLAKVVEAQAVITIQVRDKKIQLRSYDGRNGQPLTEVEVSLYPARPVQEQLKQAIEDLAKKFRNSWPYQAFQVSQSHQLMTSQGATKIARIYVGRDLELAAGDEVQWISLPAVSTSLLFQNPSEMRAVAEGRVLSREGEYADVTVAEGASGQAFFEGALVRLPGAQFGYKENMTSEQLYAEFGAASDPEILAAQKREAKQGPATTGMAFLLGIAAFILIAF